MPNDRFNFLNHSQKIGESILDFVLVFLAIAVLTVGVVRIWGWFNANYAGREVAYQRSRLITGNLTGQPPRNYNKAVDIGAGESTGTYKPFDLTEDWVFKGRPSGRVSFEGIGELPGSGDVTTQCKESCKSAPDCVNGEEFNSDCPCYVQCICQGNIKPALDSYDAQIRAVCGDDRNCNPPFIVTWPFHPPDPSLLPPGCNPSDFCECLTHIPNVGGLAGHIFQKCIGKTGNCGAACSLRHAAKSMRDEANKCDDPWEPCSWFNDTAGQLRQNANELDNQASLSEQEGRDLIKQKDETEKCCAEETEPEQEICIQFATAGGCEGMVKNGTQYWQAQIDDYQKLINDLKASIVEIGMRIMTCSASAALNCHGDAACTQTFMSNCCKTYQGWSRDCFTPTNRCDEDCFAFSPPLSPCPKCGLTEVANRAQEKIPELETAIQELNGKIDGVKNCCSLATQEEQLNCITEATKEAH